MWYVIQTITGKEEELMLFIRTILCREHFESCFVIDAEWMKRLGGEWQIQVRPLFPGYVFIETKEPEQVFAELKGVPKFSKLLGNGMDEFIPVRREEEQFLRMIMNETDRDRNENIDKAVVKLTAVETEENGEIRSIEGALSYFKKEIVKVNLHKRYAVVRTKMLGEERSLMFGIWLKRDETLKEKPYQEMKRGVKNAVD